MILRGLDSSFDPLIQGKTSVQAQSSQTAIGTLCFPNALTFVTETYKSEKNVLLGREIPTWRNTNEEG